MRTVRGLSQTEAVLGVAPLLVLGVAPMVVLGVAPLVGRHIPILLPIYLRTHVECKPLLLTEKTGRKQESIFA